MLSYAEYWWEYLEIYNVAQYYQILGWTRGSWEEGDATPVTENYYWDDLSARQKVAAGQLCFFEKLWDGYPVDEMGGGRM